MAGESINDRAKASKLRKLKNPTAEQRDWLARYDERVVASTIKKAKALPSGDRHTPVARLDDGQNENKMRLTRPGPSELPRAPELDSAPGVVVHETKRLDDALDAADFQWSPIVPAAAEGETTEAPAPGAPPRPEPGSPIVEETTPKPEGDPAAAAQFAGLVVFVTGIGIASALELLPDDAPVPPVIRSLIESDETHKKLLTEVGAAAARVAVKYNFRSVPMGDELVVAGSVAGSVLAFLALHKRKQAEGTTVKPEAAAPPSNASTRGVGDVDPSAPIELPPVLAGVFT
jgi:hypothetical protein